MGPTGLPPNRMAIPHMYERDQIASDWVHEDIEDSDSISKRTTIEKAMFGKPLEVYLIKGY